MRISFKQVKELVPLQTVIDYYGISLRTVGKEQIGPCPLHRGDNPTAFHLNTKINRWKCFTRCGHGDIIDFVSIMEHCSLFEAAKLIIDEISPGCLPLVHPFFEQRKFDQNTLNIFGIQYQQKGPWNGMITIPLHDKDGCFVGYLGRRLYHFHKGKYKVQKGVHRSQLLYNHHRIQMSELVYVVEGPFDVLRLYQAGYTNAVALLGIQLSEYQASILEDGLPILLLDQDDAGRIASSLIQSRINHAKILTLPAKDPASMMPNEIRLFLESSNV